MRSALKSELLRLVKWPAVWSMVVVLLAGIMIGDLVEVVNLHQVSPDVHTTIVNNLTLPGAITSTLKLVYIFSAVLVSILAASSIGSEYSWGTLRPMLASGLSRRRFLMAKFVALVLAALTFVLLPLVMNSLLAIGFAPLLGRPFMSSTVDVAWLGALTSMCARTLLVIMVPMTIAFMFGVLGRSPVLGIGVSLGLMVADQVLQLLLESLGVPWARTVDKMLVGQLSHSLMLHNSFTHVPSFPPGLISQGGATATLLLYAAVSLVLALIVFNRRDVGGPA